MKIKLLAGALLIGSGVAFAQTNRAINYTPTTSVQSSINKLFSQLNTTGINSGILMDKSPNFVSADLYDGSTNSATATTNTWYQLMAQTRAAQLSGNNNFLSDTYLLDTVSGQNANNRISLGLLFINYHKIKNPATATQGWFTLSNGKLVDVPNRTENPYQQNVLVATAPLKQHNADGEVKFIIPSSLVMNNRGAFTLQADWGLGNGYQNIQLNTEYPITYTSVGSKNITLKLTQGGVDYYAKTTFNVEHVFTFGNVLYKNCPGICFDVLWSDVDYSTALPITTAEAYIIYANGRSHLQKPIIFVEGQDVLDEYNFKDLYLALSNDDPNNQNAPSINSSPMVTM